jgi:hypothetical protein
MLALLFQSTLLNESFVLCELLEIAAYFLILELLFVRYLKQFSPGRLSDCGFGIVPSLPC